MHYQHIESIAPTPTACADQEEDVDIGTNDEPYEQSVAAEDMEIDEKPQVSIFPNKNKIKFCVNLMRSQVLHRAAQGSRDIDVVLACPIVASFHFLVYQLVDIVAAF
jgi:hypothetical protein